MIGRLRMAAVAAIAASLAAGSASAEPRTTINISAVRASNVGHRFDDRLKDLREELRSLRFKSYTLVSNENRTVAGTGDQCGIELPHGRYLNITTREHTQDHLRMNILLNENNRPVINTDVRLESDSVVLIGGPHDTDGTLIITISTKSIADAARPSAKRDTAVGDGETPPPTCTPTRPLSPAPSLRPQPMPRSPSLNYFTTPGGK